MKMFVLYLLQSSVVTNVTETQ